MTRWRAVLGVGLERLVIGAGALDLAVFIGLQAVQETRIERGLVGTGLPTQAFLVTGSGSSAASARAISARFDRKRTVLLERWSTPFRGNGGASSCA